MVEFVSYDGEYPNLCSGTLVLRINGELRTLQHCLSSGGGVYHDDDWNFMIASGAWTVWNLPDDLEVYQTEIENCVNENIPFGCCGGCI